MSPLPPPARQALAHLRPERARREANRIANKWRRRLGGTDRRVVTLEPEARARGDVLVSYIIDPVLLPLDAELPRSHTHFWESRQIAKTFLELGYRVDFVSWKNQEHRPKKTYRAVVDVRLNLERWQNDLAAETLKIFHGETAHWRFNNEAQQERLDSLFERRGFRLRPNKMLEPNRAIESADVGLVLGNEFTLGTYAFAGKPLEPLQISTPVVYPAFERDYGTARRHFVWLGSGGLVHKGLDRVLEVFAGLPRCELWVCGPIHQERDFERAYYRELYDLPNVHTLGWVDVASSRFRELARRSSALLYPSCSEGQCGAVVTSMHAGLIPVVSATSGVPIDDAYGHELADCELGTLRDAVLEIADRPQAELERMSASAREYARAHHTREAFAARYRECVERLLE